MIEYATHYFAYEDGASADVRLVWYLDDVYRPEDSWGLEEPDQTRVVNAEREALESGELVALGCVVEKECPCCGAWNTHDSLWGIVIEPDDDALVKFARSEMDGLTDEYFVLE